MKQRLLNQQFGTRIKTLRIKNKLTQINLAAAVDIDVRTINRIESGTYNPTLKIIAGLALALNVSLSELFKPID